MKQAEYDFYSYYEGLAQHVGVANLIKIVPFSKEQIKTALMNDDIHLNTLPLNEWDIASGSPYYTLHGKKIAVDDPYGKASWEPSWDKTRRMGLSIANRVCVLKHVARYYIAEWQRPARG